MQQLIMTIGLPGSGKTTWAKEYLKEHPEAMRINKDDLRQMIDAGKHSKRKEGYILQYRNTLADLGLSAGRTVIIDDTNLNPIHQEKLGEIAKSHDVPLVVESFLGIPLKDCIENDLKRERSVGKDVIMGMYKEYLAPKPAQPPKMDPELPDAIICDLDGTLAHMVDRGPFDEKKCGTDICDESVSSLVRLMSNQGRNILYVSGRHQFVMKETYDWLVAHDLPVVNCRLLMRKDDDNRKDSIIKKEIYDEYIKGNYNIDFVLDDRNQVVEMWRSLGLKCLQVEEGDF